MGLDFVYWLSCLRIFKNQVNMKTYTFDEVKDQIMGIIGTSRRDEFELELKFDLLGDMIKSARKELNLTQKEFGELIGVQNWKFLELRKMPVQLIFRHF